MDGSSLFARVALRGALRHPLSEGRVRGYADRFDSVQAIAEELDLAGDFEETHCRSEHAGTWTWRDFLKEAVGPAKPGRPPAYAHTGAFEH